MGTKPTHAPQHDAVAHEKSGEGVVTTHVWNGCKFRAKRLFLHQTHRHAVAAVFTIAGVLNIIVEYHAEGSIDIVW